MLVSFACLLLIGHRGIRASNKNDIKQAAWPGRVVHRAPETSTLSRPLSDVHRLRIAFLLSPPPPAFLPHTTTFTIAMSTDVFDADGRLSEAYVQEMFHSYLKSSLAQAKAEHLVDVQMLSSAEVDLMLTGENFSL